jgi:hypothetical protein
MIYLPKKGFKFVFTKLYRFSEANKKKKKKKKRRRKEKKRKKKEANRLTFHLVNRRFLFFFLTPLNKETSLFFLKQMSLY